MSSRVLTDGDSPMIGTTGEVIDISDDDAGISRRAPKGRAATPTPRAGVRSRAKHGGEVESKDEDVKGKRKRGMSEQESSDDEEKDELDDGGRVSVVRNNGQAPKGGLFDYADRAMKFCSFAWAFASQWGAEDQKSVASMVAPLARLEMGHGYEVSGIEPVSMP